MKTAIVVSAIFDLFLFWGMYKLLKKSRNDVQILFVFIGGLTSIGLLFIGLMYAYQFIIT